ncbi:MAG: hypothetical protein ACI4MG_10465 [Aristaeellaceae bacterium]
MLRETNVQRLHWSEKTMSLLRQQQLEACEKRLNALPDFGLYTYDDDLRTEELWQCSFGAQEAPRMTHLHTLHELRAQVLSQLPTEAALLTVEEHRLVERMLLLEGEAELLDWEEMSAAESLVRRLWCVISREEQRFVLHLPQELMTPLTMVLSSRRHEELRERLIRHDAVIRALLYLGGLLHYEEPLEHLLEDVLETDARADDTLAMRYLRNAYDYTYDAAGDMLLLHPGLAEPEQLLKMPMPDSGITAKLDEETIRGAIEGVLPGERPLFERLFGLLHGATRPEIMEDEAAEDLRMLAKQGVPLQVMQEVLGSMLLQSPTQDMLDAVSELHALTPRWGVLHMARLQ